MAAAKTGDIKSAIGYANTSSKIVKSLHAEALDNKQFLATSEAATLIDKTVSQATAWLTDNQPDLDPETTIPDAISCVCNKIAKELTQHAEPN